MIKNNPIIAVALFLSALLIGSSAHAHTATADSSTGRINEDPITGVRTVKTNSGSYGYVGNVGATNSVAVFCFQIPNYPSGEVIDSAEIAVFINNISNTGGTLGNASLYGVRSSATAGIQASDYSGGTELVGSMLASSAGTGYVIVSDTGSTPLVDWLAANANPNEYIVLRMETDSVQANYNRYNLSDESVSGEEPTLTFTSSAPAATSYDAVADSSSGRVYENTSTSARTTSSTSGAYTYVGNVGANNSVAVFCFKLPDYPSGSTVNAATLSAYVNLIANSPGNASVYGVRSSSTAGIQTSDFSGGTLVVSDFITSSSGTGFVTVEDTGSGALVDWLAANAEPNEYVVFRVEPNTTQTGYSRYNLSDESITGEEPSLSFEIGSGGSPGGWGDVAWDPTPWSEADGVTWESMSTLNTEIQNTPSGGTLDLTGRYFRSLPNASHITISSPINIAGGYFSGATSLSWTSVGSGVYKASIDLSTLGQFGGLTMLEDPDAITVPQIAIHPAPPAGTLFEQSRMTSNPNWWILHNGGKDSSGDFEPGTIVNSIVHTVAGDDVYGSEILGFTITDSTVRSEVNAAISGDVDSLLIIYHAGPNQIFTDTISSWNGTTGELTLASGGVAKFLGYAEFALTGRQEFIDGEAGAYSIDLATDEIYYKPADGNPVGAGIAANPIIFKISTNGVTFTNSKFSGTNGRLAAAGMLVGTGAYSTTLRSCTFMLGNDGIRGLEVDMELCQFSHLFGRGLIAEAGSTVKRNRFEHIDGSCIFVGRSNVGFDPDVAMASTVIEGNYFYSPTAAHGQGISLYQCTWQNATVRNNIFHSCSRAISFQPYSGNVSLRTRAAGVFRFENNLVWTSELPFPYDNGQSTVAFNGAYDTHLTSGEQDVFIRYNVVGADTDDFHPRVFNMTIHKFVHSNVWVDGNIAGSINAADDEVGYLVHQRSKNLLGSAFPLTQYGAAYGSTDLPDAASSTVYDRENSAAIGSAATAASDGGPVGIRWLAIPTPAELVDLPLDWVDVALPQTLPTSTAWSDAFNNTDNR